jgi:hypothetical protein
MKSSIPYAVYSQRRRRPRAVDAVTGDAHGGYNWRVVAAGSFILAPALAPIVRPGVLWWDGATVVDREPRLDELLREA